MICIGEDSCGNPLILFSSEKKERTFLGAPTIEQVILKKTCLFLALLQHLWYNIFENQSETILRLNKYFVE